MDAITDIESKQREERARTHQDADALRALVVHPGWTVYIALVERVAQNYHAAIMKPIESLLEAPKTEFNKGTLSGLSLATALPSLKVKESDELRPQGAQGAQGDEE